MSSEIHQSHCFNNLSLLSLDCVRHDNKYDHVNDISKKNMLTKYRPLNFYCRCHTTKIFLVTSMNYWLKLTKTMLDFLECDEAISSQH